MPELDPQAPAMAPSEDRESEAPPSDPDESPGSADALDVAVLLSLDDGAAISSRLVPPELSPELARILQAAEDRVGAFEGAHGSNPPAADEAPDLLLPAELLAALDEPIDPDDTSSGASGKAQTTGTTGRLAPTGAVSRALREGTTPGIAPAIAPALGSDPGASRGSVATGSLPQSIPMKTEAGSWIESASQRQEAHTGVDMSALSAEPRMTALTAPASVFPGIDPPVAIGNAQGFPHPPEAPSRGVDEAPRAPRLGAVLGEGDAVRALASVIASRASGSLALGPASAVRRIVLHDGDIVTTASTAADETLVAFLHLRGDLERDVAARLASRLPPSGRHAGAALVGHGHLGQDDLWPTLRAHAEWIIGQALRCDEGSCELEDEVPARLKAEPNVFGGATGAEVLLEQIRRVIPPEVALARLGGVGAHVAEGPRPQLLGECALGPDEVSLVRSAPGRTVGELLGGDDAELADVLYGLAALGVVEVVAPIRRVPSAVKGGRRDGGDLHTVASGDPLDDEALRQRVRARMALVEDGDYFALLGVPRGATGYEVRRAYLELRRAFEPARALTANTADLAADLRLVLEVLDEAYEILREPNRRDRYRRAIEAGPP